MSAGDQPQASGWRVHISGPDDIIDASSRLDAMVRAHDINIAAIRSLSRSGDDPFMPTVWASPVPPGETR